MTIHTRHLPTPLLHEWNPRRALSASTDDDLIMVLEDDASDDTGCALEPAWQILIADDDRSVHDATLAALGGMHLHNRPLAFTHAYSAAETLEILASTPGIDLVLLDVVMESPDAGLRAVPEIRGRLALQHLKIIVRTGQPGNAPEEDIRRNYAIDGYAKKAELTRSLLRDVIAQALAPSPTSAGTH